MVLLKETVIYSEVLDLSSDALTKWDLGFSRGRGSSMFYV